MVLSVLIVDDSRAMRCLQYNVLCQLRDMDIFEAEDGFSAIHKLQDRNFQIDLILLDWMMPNMDGLTLAGLLKSNENLSKIPILMMTGLSDERKMRAAWRTGVDGCLLKPFTREMLLNAILSLDPERLSEKSAFTGGATLTSEGTAAVDQLPLYMVERVMKLGETITIENKTPLLFKDDPVQQCFIVLEGSVEEPRKGLISGEHYVKTYGPGEGLAVTELLTGDDLTSNFFALPGAKLARMHKSDFETMLLNHPEITIPLSRFLATKTRMITREKTGEDSVFKSFLDNLDMPNLVQALYLRQVTGVIDLSEIGASIDLYAGQVVSAYHPECQPEDGQASFQRILEDNPENISFRIEEPNNMPNVQVATSVLLLNTLQVGVQEA